MGRKERRFKFKNDKIKKHTNSKYTIHLKFMYIGIVFFIFGFKFPKLFQFTIFFELIGLAFMFKNWKRINNEYEQSKLAKKK